MNMAVCSRWLSYLCIILSIKAFQSSRITDSFYSKLDHLLNRTPDPLKPQGSADVSAVSEVESWPNGPFRNLGQISGVVVNLAGQPVVFHRGPRVWDFDSFNETNHFQQIVEGPIRVDTVVTLDADNGNILSSWGGGIFYLPHGIHIDGEGNTWLTDVALHQVFKFSPESRHPLLTFGKRFKPGSGFGHLCKPTSVAVAQDGHIFIADGYCNSRILKFNHFGDLVQVFPQNEELMSLKVPHSLTLMEKQGLLCIADRENMRVVCINSEMDRSTVRTQLRIQQAALGRIYAVASKGDFVYAVNGPTSRNLPIQGFTLNPVSETIVDHWEPSSDVFRSPHDLAVSPDGQYMYVVELLPNRIWKFSL